MSHIFTGLLTAIAKTYFSSDLSIEIISKSSEQVGDKKCQREHVIFSLVVTKGNYKVEDDGPPTFVAQTKKHGEKQILKSVRDEPVCGPVFIFCRSLCDIVTKCARHSTECPVLTSTNHWERVLLNCGEYGPLLAVYIILYDLRQFEYPIDG